MSYERTLNTALLKCHVAIYQFSTCSKQFSRCGICQIDSNVDIGMWGYYFRATDDVNNTYYVCILPFINRPMQRACCFEFFKKAPFQKNCSIPNNKK